MFSVSSSLPFLIWYVINAFINYFEIRSILEVENLRFQHPLFHNCYPIYCCSEIFCLPIGNYEWYPKTNAEPDSNKTPTYPYTETYTQPDKLEPPETYISSHVKSQSIYFKVSIKYQLKEVFSFEFFKRSNHFYNLIRNYFI